MGRGVDSKYKPKVVEPSKGGKEKKKGGSSSAGKKEPGLAAKAASTAAVAAVLTSIGKATFRDAGKPCEAETKAFCECSAKGNPAACDTLAKALKDCKAKNGLS